VLAGNDRWVEVAPSQFAHERAALEAVRTVLPEEPPYRAWSNLELITGDGRMYEVDLLILAPAGFFLVELKAWGGRLTGDRHRWVLRGERTRTEDSPLPLANIKAKVLRSLLEAAVRRQTHGGKAPPGTARKVPFVRAAVVLHGPDLRNELPEEERAGIYALDGRGHATGLPELVRGLVTRIPDPQNVVTARFGDALALLLDDAGIGRRKQRSVGSYRLLEQLGEGPGWQDSRAQHVRFPDELVRIRTWHTGRATSGEERGRLERAADREYRLLRRLDHPGLVAPTEFLDTEGGPALVYPYDPHAERLDLMLARRGGELDLAERLALIRGMADTLRYAHGRRIAHRGLSPYCVLVRPGRVPRITDWQTANRAGGTGSSSLGGTLGPLGSTLVGTRHPDALLTSAQQGYAAPEALVQGAYDASFDEVRADVFSLGAVAYLVLTGTPPATDALTLRQRLRAEGGLDLLGALDAAPPSLRELLMEATKAAVGDRIASVEDFLELLSVVEAELAEPEQPGEPDPLDAEPETLLGGRFLLKRRLGSGSTAVGLLVEDTAAGGSLRVLKVARDEERAARLRDELEVLAPLPPLVEIAALAAPTPLTVGDRTALLLELAGEQTLAQQLRQARRLSLDLLERYGIDLLAAAARLEEHGVDHRDIKPANLGVRERPGSRTKHLVLFDFSLARAAVTDLTAGTPPYLDPFLGPPARPRWDAAAERYAVAVTLFEMATGTVPVFGDGASDPAVVADEATVEPSMFDPGVAGDLVAFFARALRRDAEERFPTVAEMANAWSRVWSSIAMADAGGTVRESGTTGPAVTLRTPLASCGLSPRALSALEPFGLTTVADLLAVPRFRISRLSGVADASRKEIQARVSMWRDLLPTLPGPEPAPPRTAPGGVDDLVHSLLPRETPRNALEVAVARLLLGLPVGDGTTTIQPEPWPTPARLARTLGEKRGRVQQVLADLRARWARTQAVIGLRAELGAILAELGGVGTDEELVAALLAHRPAAGPDAQQGVQARCLVALAVEAELEPAVAADTRWVRRRHGSVVLVGSETDGAGDGPAQPEAGRWLDHVVALGEAAVDAVAGGEVLAPVRAVELLRAVPEVGGSARLETPRLVALAAAASGGRAAVSARQELYPVGLAPVAAVRAAQAATAGMQVGTDGPSDVVTVADLRARVRARFPAAAELPDRPALDVVLRDAGSVLTWDPTGDAYRAPLATPTTLATHSRTVPPPGAVLVPASRDEVDIRLRDSLALRAFLALGVPPQELERLPGLLRQRYGVTVLNVTDILLNRMRATAAAAGVAWDEVLAADAADPGSPDGMGLRGLVDTAVGAVTEAVAAAPGPILLTEASPLARYGHLDLLAPLADHASRASSAIWLLVPVGESGGAPVVDGQPVPILSPSQWLRLPASWPTGGAAALLADTASAGMGATWSTG